MLKLRDVPAIIPVSGDNAKPIKEDNEDAAVTVVAVDEDLKSRNRRKK